VPEGSSLTPAPGVAPDALGPRAPGSIREVFVVFTRMALQGFGGVLPVSQHMLVEREQWLTRRSYAEILTLSQVLPGPNVVNLALVVGDRFFGWRGAAAALGGMVGVPLVVVLLLAALYANLAQHPMAAGAMRGMGAVAAGLVLGSALKLLPALRGHVLGPWACGAIVVATFVVLALARWPLVFVVLGLGGASVAWCWWRLVRARGDHA
jgi:chromate transporter